MGFYIPEEDILHSHCSENLKYHGDDKFTGKIKDISNHLALNL
jgi:hypothetical protein